MVAAAILTPRRVPEVVERAHPRRDVVPQRQPHQREDVVPVPRLQHQLQQRVAGVVAVEEGEHPFLSSVPASAVVHGEWGRRGCLC